MSDDKVTPSFDEVTKTDAITGGSAGGATDDPGDTTDASVSDADAAVDERMSNATLVNADQRTESADTDSSETIETDDVGYSAAESPNEGVSEIGLDESVARADEETATDDNSGGGALAGDEVAMHRLENETATNDAVAGETVIDESAPPEGTPYYSDSAQQSAGDDLREEQ